MKNNFTKSISILLITIVASSLLFSGCNGTKSTKSGSGEDAPTSSRTNTSTINYGIPTAWSTLNPYDDPAGGTMYDILIWDKIYDKLAYTSQAGEVIEPRNAKSWESTDGGKSIIFHLNENAKWHDGEPVTADDWVYTVQLITDPDSNLAGGGLSFLEGTDEAGKATSDGSAKAEAIDKYTLKLTLKNITDPNEFLVLNNRGFFVLPKHLLQSTKPAEIKDIDYWKTPVGSGPLVYESEIVGNQLVLNANKNYYLGAPGFGKLDITVIASTNVLSSLISGELDYFAFGNAVYTKDEKKIAEDSGFTVSESKVKSNFTEVILNNTSISDSKIRQALHYALDKNVLSESSTQGLGSLASSYLLQSSEYYNTDLSIGRDVKKAKQLLKEAGYDSKTVYKMAIGESRASIAALMQQEWAEAGIKVEIITVDVATMFSGLTEGKYDIGISGHTATSNPLWFAGFLSSASKNNYSVTDSAYDDWSKKISVETDAAKRKQLIWEFQKFIFDNTPFIPLWHTGSLFVNSKTVQNIDYEAAAMCNENVWEWKKE